jgi:hypothetical protein
VNRSPEKHIAAMDIKKTNSDIMARRALTAMSPLGIATEKAIAHRTIILFDIAKNASLYSC